MPDESKIHAALRGIALGDALGLPYEALGPKRIARRLGSRPLKPALLPGMMMVSDDTDHACMALATWRESGGSAEQFSKLLGRRFKWWFACLPPGIGLATAKSAIRLWLGWNPEASGVRSAGNGPLMRAGILGVALAHDQAMRREIVRRSTLLTHCDPRALDGAHVLAEACAHLAMQGRPQDAAGFCMELATHATTDEIQHVLQTLAGFNDSGMALDDFLHRSVCRHDAKRARRGFSGYIPESLAAALAAFLHGGPDAMNIIRTAILFGGDTDSIASFAGCLAGAADAAAFHTEETQKLLNRLIDFPWNATSLERLAQQQHATFPTLVLRPLRNLAQLAIVLGHGLLRLTGR